MIERLKLFPNRVWIEPSMSIIKEKDGSSKVTIIVSCPIMETMYFTRIFGVLATLTKEDKVTTFINTPGGDVSTLQQWEMACDACEAHMTTVATGMIASAGVPMWCTGDKMEFSPITQVMMHTSAHGCMMKSEKVLEYSAAIISSMKDAFQPMVDKKLVTEAEREDLFEHKQDVWLTADDLKDRGFKNEA